MTKLVDKINSIILKYNKLFPDVSVINKLNFHNIKKDDITNFEFSVYFDFKNYKKSF
jgi:hypothetical protein